MFVPTETDCDHMRQALLNLAQVEVARKHLPYEILILAFHLLAYGAPVARFSSGKEAADYLTNRFPPDPEKYLGYVGACWIVEDHF